MDIGRLKNNYEYYDDSEFADNEVFLSLKEAPEFNLHIDESYFSDIFGKPIRDGKMWTGFTRDYQEEKGGWEKKTEIEDIDEYIDDMLRYSDRQFRWEETPEVYNLVIDFLTYAKTTGQTVVVEVY